MLLLVARLAAAVAAVRRLAGAARRAEPLTAVDPSSVPSLPSISVLIPARDEAARLGPLLDQVMGSPGVLEVVVVDDGSTDDTAAVAAAAGARVVAGAALPPDWAGKAWALHQGVQAVRGSWVVTLDADTRPDPALAASLVARCLADGVHLATVGGSFECPSPGAAWLHPAQLTTLVYRFGPAGAVGVPADRLLANGQCQAFPRAALLAEGGMSTVAAHVVEDVALARRLARRGWRVAFYDGADLLTVRMYDDLVSTWRGWARSLALPGVEPRARQLSGLAVVVLAQAAPLVRAVTRRADALDGVLLLLRAGTLIGTSRVYGRRGIPYWTSPLADVAAAAAVAAGIIRPRQRWRGRLAPATRPARSGARRTS